MEHVDAYLEAVRREGGIQRYEITLDTSHVLRVPKQKGTADTVVLDTERDTLTVIDAKFGFNQVDAPGNKQGLLYIAGARRKYEHVAQWRKFGFIIVQPRINHYDPVTYTAEQVDAFEEQARVAAAKALALIGQPREAIEAAMVPSEHGCKWCPIRGSCPARARGVAAMFDPAPNAAPTLSDADIGAYLPRIAAIEGWCHDLELEAHNRALAGHTIPGYKLITGKNGPRFWKDPKIVPDALTDAGLPREVLYNDPALKSPTEIEKIAKARKLKVEGLKSDDKSPLVAQSPPKPKLVSEETPGTAWSPVKLEFDITEELPV